MSVNKEARMAAAFINFKKAYNELVSASKAMGPDFDVSMNYPFYLLDFEEINSAVQTWCLVQAEALLQRLPDKVMNPACVACPHRGTEVKANSECTRGTCPNFPVIVFTRDAVTPYLKSRGFDDQELRDIDDAALQLLYIQETRS